MPTGYTSELSKGEQSFKDFVLCCARSTIYDCSELPQSIEIDKHYKEQMVLAKAALSTFKKMSQKKRLELFNQEIADNNKWEEDYHKELDAENARYEKMAEQVRQWTIPNDYENLRQFMLQQLQISMNTKPYHKKLTDESFTDWEIRKLKRLCEDVAYYTKEYNSAITRCEDANRWIKGLRKLLG